MPSTRKREINNKVKNSRNRKQTIFTKAKLLTL